MMKVQLLARLAQVKLQWAELRDQMDAASERGDWPEFARHADACGCLASEGVLANLLYATSTDEEVTQPGPTGELPQGRLVPDDAGELQLVVGCYRRNVAIHFGKPIAWFACPPSQGRELAAMFIAAADRIEGQTDGGEAIVDLPADVGPTDMGKVQDLLRQLPVVPGGHALPPEWQERTWAEIARDELSPEALAVASCPSCTRVGISRALVEEQWLYGDALNPDAQVTLSAVVPRYTCAACGFTWTDDEAENLREAAVRRHLAGLVGS